MEIVGGIVMEERIDNRGKEIQDQIAKSLSKDLNIPVYSIDKELIDKVYEDVNQITEISEHYTERELYSEVSTFISNSIVFRPANNDEWKEHVESFLTALEKEKSYIATIILPNVIGLPIGTRIGPLEVTEELIQDEKLKEFLDYMHRNKGVPIEERTQVRVAFKAYTSVNVVDIFYDQVELPLAILSLILDFDLDTRNCLGQIQSTDIPTIFYLRPQKEIIGWSRFLSKHYSGYLTTLSKISLNSPPNRLEKKILQAIQVNGLSRYTRKPEIRYIFLVSSLESLLLTSNDRDYLGKKLSEKTAFLIGSNFEERIKIYKLMKKSYSKRSSLIHKGEVKITENEVRTLEGIFKRLVFKILDLSVDYPKMEQKSHENDLEGIEDYINTIKFS